MKYVRPAAVVAALVVCGSALAAGNTPIRNQAQAVRAAILLDNTQFWAVGYTDTFQWNARGIADGVLRKLAAATTPAQLVAMPGGLTLNCAAAGSLKATMAAGWPRTVRLEWNACAETADSLVDGPAEITLISNSFTASTVAAIRLGDRQRDLTRTFVPPPNPRTGSSTDYFNMRLAGILPMGDQFGSVQHGPRFSAAISGFHKNVLLVRDFPTPGPPFYPQTIVYTAEGVVVTGENATGADWSTTDYTVLAGKFTESIETVARPNHPNAQKGDSVVRMTNLRVRRESRNGAPRNLYRVDGRIEFADHGLYGLSTCTPTETYTYRTRSPVASDPFGPYLWFYDGGLIDINDATVRYSATGTFENGDLAMHLDFRAPRLGAFRVDAPTGLIDLVPGAGCAP